MPNKILKILLYDKKAEEKTGGLFGCNGSVPFSYANRPFPSVSKRREGHFHGRNGRPTERSRLCQIGLGVQRTKLCEGFFPLFFSFFPFSVSFSLFPYFIFSGFFFLFHFFLFIF